MSDNAEKWISEYAELSRLYGDAIEEGNHKQANKAYDKLMNVYRQIKKLGALSSTRFHDLLSSPSMGTRLWAATHYLAISNDEAEKVLASLGKVPNSLLALSAKITLEEWEKGRLVDFDKNVDSTVECQDEKTKSR